MMRGEYIPAMPKEPPIKHTQRGAVVLYTPAEQAERTKAYNKRMKTWKATMQVCCVVHTICMLIVLDHNTN
jgi:hypothetical protein